MCSKDDLELLIFLPLSPECWVTGLCTYLPFPVVRELTLAQSFLSVKYSFYLQSYIPSPVNSYQWNLKSELNVNPVLGYHEFKLLSKARDAVYSQGKKAQSALCMALASVFKQWPFLAAKLSV